MIWRIFICICTLTISTSGFSKSNNDFYLNGTSGTMQKKPYRPVNLYGGGTNPTYGEGKTAVLKSLAFPGWGLYAASGKKYWFAAGVISYGAIAYGAWSKVKSKKSYDLYLNATDNDEIQEHFDLANRKHRSFISLVSIGAGVYVFSALGTLIYGAYNDIYRKRTENWTASSRWSVLPNYDFNAGAVGLSLNFKL